MDSSSPNNKTIGTKEEKWKLLLGETCHDTLAGSVLGLNPTAAGLGLSTPRQPAQKARLASPVGAACCPAGLPPRVTSSTPHSARLRHGVYAAHSAQGGRDGNR